jgi:3-hydroxyacyl-[acyl-carrier-protein] dehydratase
MLQGDFFIISKIETTEAEIKAELIINARHKIFEGHFPGQPVVPGVCMMQMVKEIIEKVTEKKMDLIKSSEMKFLAIVDPLQNNIISATLKYTMDENQHVLVSAVLFKDAITHFKFKGLFTFQK